MAALSNDCRFFLTASSFAAEILLNFFALFFGSDAVLLTASDDVFVFIAAYCTNSGTQHAQQTPTLPFSGLAVKGKPSLRAAFAYFKMEFYGSTVCQYALPFPRKMFIKKNTVPKIIDRYATLHAQHSAHGA